MKEVITFPLLLLLIATLISADGKPTVDKEPIRFTLDTKQDAINKTVTNLQGTEFNPRIQNGMEWLGRIADAVRLGRGRLVNSIAITRNIVVDRVEEFTNEARNNVAGVIGAANDIIDNSSGNLQSHGNSYLARLSPSKADETVRLEFEKEQSILGNNKPLLITTFLKNMLKPRPIIDNLKEEEKYGNNGDKFIGIGRALVNGFEGLSNFFNTVADLPVNTAKQTSRGITEVLNQFGAKLVGLQ